MIPPRLCALPVLIALLIVATTTSRAEDTDETGFESLFNGKDLTGWTGDTEGYQAEDGLLVCKPGGNLYTERDFANFVFRFEFKLTPGANNGVGLRVVPGTHASIDALEIQILDDTADKYKDIHDYQYHGSIYGIVPAKQGHLKPVGEWNEEEILADGDHIKVTLNGVVIADADIKEASKNGTVDGKDHPGIQRKDGRIGFLGHGSLLYFRNIRVKPLPN